MAKKTSMYCFCDAAHTRFTGGYLTTNRTPTSDVIEISLKFEKTNNDSTKEQQTQAQRGNLNFVELSEKTLRDVCVNDSIHDCIKDLLRGILIKKSSDDIPPLLTSVTVHQQQQQQQQSPAIIMNDDDIFVDLTNQNEDKTITRSNSSKRSSMKSSKSMETVLEKSLCRAQKDKSPDESKAKSVSNVNDDKIENEGDYENGESIELIFISDEFVNKVNRQEVIVLDEKDGKRRESLTNKKKLVIITDDFKEKVLRNNSIVITNERKMLKKLKQPSKTFNTNSNSFLTYDEPDSNNTIFLEDKRLGDKKLLQQNDK